MAEFQNSIPLILQSEGGYKFDNNDRGGAETYRGITRKYFPTWQGWGIIDSNKPLSHGEIINDANLESLVKQFYYTNFWNKCLLDSCDSQKIASFIFDWFVNSGSSAIKHIQEVAGVPADGHCGNQTIDAINGWHEADLLPKLITARVNFYKAIVANDPSQSEYLNGWVARAESFA